MLALVLALTVAAPPSARLAWEQKCLYCHSEEVSESRRLTEPQWRRLIEQKRKRAPLLISRSDVELLTRYVVHTLKLVAAAPKPPSRAVEPPAPPKVVEPKVEPRPAEPVVELKAPVLEPLPEPPVVEAPAMDPELEQRAQDVLRQRCSKCHTLGRVYGKLDTFERSMATLERMRLKTGSGITDDELALLEDYLRTQF